MLSKSKRLSTEQFTKAFAVSRPVHSDLFILRANRNGESRFAVSVSKKVAKTAVVRNKIRRRVYSSIREIGEIKKSAHTVIIVKSDISKIDYKKVVSELKNLFVKAGILE